MPALVLWWFLASAQFAQSATGELRLTVTDAGRSDAWDGDRVSARPVMGYRAAMSGRRWYYVITLSVIAGVLGFVLFTVVTRILPALS